MPDVHEVTVERRVGARADQVYDAVSDVTRMGQWSPETTSCRWLRGSSGPAAGARFRGANRRGWRRWSTTCSVVSADPGARFAFDVKLGVIPMAQWTYEFIPDADGCVVRESWVEGRPGWLVWLDPKIMGVAGSGRAQPGRHGNHPRETGRDPRALGRQGRVRRLRATSPGSIASL